VIVMKDHIWSRPVTNYRALVCIVLFPDPPRISFSRLAAAAPWSQGNSLSFIIDELSRLGYHLAKRWTLDKLHGYLLDEHLSFSLQYFHTGTQPLLHNTD
jgi:hypothetical protein